MSASRTRAKEQLYGDIKTNILVVEPEPETDINVKRGLTLAIGGTIAGAAIALCWFVYRLFAPIEGIQEMSGAADYIVVPFLGIFYSLLGAVVGGCVGVGMGTIFMGLAALKDARESEEDEGEEEPLPRTRGAGTIRGSY